jgi:tellurite resistance protein
MQIGRPVIPVTHFAAVLGLAGLGNDWRIAHRVWNLPPVIGESLMLLATIVWGILLILYVAKWITARKEARAELDHPILCCYVALVGVATLLIAGAAIPHSRIVAEILFAIGAMFTLAFAAWQTARLWQGGRDPATTTAALYLPAGAGSFVTATVASALGYADWGQLAFGAGLFSWIAIESVLMHRLFTLPALATELRPSLGIQLAPPAVGVVAYLAVTSGPVDMLARAMIGYGILQMLVLLCLLPSIRQQPFAASYWAFTFGATALAAAPLLVIERGGTGAIALIAPTLFVAANIVVVLVVLATLRLGLSRPQVVAFVAQAGD